MEVLTKEETLKLIEEYHIPPLLGRKAAAEFLGMKVSTFDKFIATNPHLKQKAPGSAPRYCPKDLRKIFSKL